MALTTLFGTAQLELQKRLAASIRQTNGGSTVPNFLVVSLRREDFQESYRGPLEVERTRFRQELEEAARGYVQANGWRIGGTGSIVVNVVLRSIPQPCQVEVRTVNHLYVLEIFDDRGIRQLPVRARSVRIGREHDAAPVGFIGLHDGSRGMSREHLRLRYADLQLYATLIGRNETTLNSQPMDETEVQLHQGDEIACGSIKMVILEL